jgi:hypothetical protein
MSPTAWFRGSVSTVDISRRMPASSDSPEIKLSEPALTSENKAMELECLSAEKSDGFSYNSHSEERSKDQVEGGGSITDIEPGALS